jgi:hypothetical protein
LRVIEQSLDPSIIIKATMSAPGIWNLRIASGSKTETITPKERAISHYKLIHRTPPDQAQSSSSPLLRTLLGIVRPGKPLRPHEHTTSMHDKKLWLSDLHQPFLEQLVPPSRPTTISKNQLKQLRSIGHATGGRSARSLSILLHTLPAQILRLCGSTSFTFRTGSVGSRSLWRAITSRWSWFYLPWPTVQILHNQSSVPSEHGQDSCFTPLEPAQSVLADSTFLGGSYFLGEGHTGRDCIRGIRVRCMGPDESALRTFHRSDPRRPFPIL